MISPNLMFPILIAAFVGYFIRSYLTLNTSTGLFVCPSFYGMVASVCLIIFGALYNVVAETKTTTLVMLGFALLLAVGAVVVNWPRAKPRSFTIDM